MTDLSLNDVLNEQLQTNEHNTNDSPKDSQDQKTKFFSIGDSENAVKVNSILPKVA